MPMRYIKVTNDCKVSASGILICLLGCVREGIPNCLSVGNGYVANFNPSTKNPIDFEYPQIISVKPDPGFSASIPPLMLPSSIIANEGVSTVVPTEKRAIEFFSPIPKPIQNKITATS